MDFLDNISGHIVFDMDEILVNIFPTVFMYYKKNADKFKPYLTDHSIYDMDTINQRKEHDIRHHLLKGEYYNLPEEEITNILEKLRGYKADRELWNSNMYRYIEPTDLGKAIMEHRFIRREDILSITILTFSSSEVLNENKRLYVEKYFNNPKIKLVPVNGFGKRKIKKSDKLKALKLPWDVFVDDMPYNIKDFVENFDITGKKLFSPKFGYNKFSEEFLNKIKEKGGTFEYYIP
jgi:hypothetical protein